MKTGIILQLATLLLLLLGASIEGLFFSYPKNALVQFLQSLNPKKEAKKPTNIHHYHLHYYPVPTQVWARPVKAPDKLELDTLHSNHLESLGWSESEYNFIPEVNIYRPPPIQDSWSEYSVTPPWPYEDSAPEHTIHSARHEKELPKSGITVQVPLHQNIIFHHPPAKKEKPESHPLSSFFQRLKKIKNAIFSNRDDNSESNDWKSEPSVDDMLEAFVLYLKPQMSRKI